MPKIQKALFFGISAVFYFFLAYQIPRTDFKASLVVYALLFASYIYVGVRLKFRIREIILYGIFMRGIFVFATPQLSDDFYRFYWDGLMTIKGLSPYEFLPNEMILDDAIYDNLNSPNYYSIYPGINQIIFAISTWIGGSIDGFLICLHLIFILIETLCLLLVHKLFRNSQNTFLFFFNPLMILEFSGNLHFEIFTFLGLLTAIYYFNKNELLSSIGLGTAIATKLMPAIFLPIFFLRSQKKWIWIVTPLLVFIISYLPFHDTYAFKNILSSVQLYFGKFEFNSSFYFLIEDQYKWILKLILISSAGIIYWAVGKNKLTISKAINYLFFIYLLMSQSIHPWYMLGFWGIIEIKKAPELVVWSFLIFLTYITYITTPYQQQGWVNLIEYGIVISVLIWRLLSKKQKIWNP